MIETFVSDQIAMAIKRKMDRSEIEKKQNREGSVSEV